LKTKSNVIVFQDIPVYDPVTKYSIAGIIVLTIIAGIVLLWFDVLGAIIMFAVTGLDALIFWSVLPRRFLVYEDRLKIVLGWPFSINIPLNDIKQVRIADRDMASVYLGMRFITSSKNLVEIERIGGLSVLFSPSQSSTFVENLEQARSQYKEPSFMSPFS
jgi:hypothetical protein